MNFLKLSYDRLVFIKNFISLAMVQGLNYLLPLLTLPYLVRVIGIDKFGTLSFATAIIAFFVVISDYGFNFTATRDVSLNKSNKKELSEIVNCVMIIKIILMLISLLILIVLISLVPRFSKDALIYVLTFGTVIGQVLFPVWFFQGMEKMQYITIINILSKVLSTFLIFIFIKDQDDYHLVPIFLSLGSIIGGVYSLYIINKIFKVEFKWQSFRCLNKYLKGGVNLFITSLLSTLLTSSGILILGFYTSNSVVGYYSAIERLFKAVVGLFSPITQALYPMSCKYVNNEEKSRIYIVRLLVVMLIIASVVSIVIALSSNLIVVTFYGATMLNYAYILQVMMIWLFFSVMNNVIGIQYLSAKRKDKFYMFSFIISGMVTVVLNFLLIPRISLDGVLYAMVIGEIILSILMIFLVIGKRL